jgi:hypothetical protein
MSELLKPENQEMVKKSNENFQWFVKHYDELKEKYKGKYVAIHDGKVVAENTDHEQLIDYLSKEFDDRRSILVQYIKEKDYLTMI